MELLKNRQSELIVEKNSIVTIGQYVIITMPDM